MKLVNCKKAINKRLSTNLVISETQRRVSADHHFGFAFHEYLKFTDLAFISWRAQVPLILDFPIAKESVILEFSCSEGCSDRPFRNRDEYLADPLVLQFIEADEHKRPRFTRGGRSFHEKILRTTFGIGSRLHCAHAHFILLLT